MFSYEVVGLFMTRLFVQYNYCFSLLWIRRNECLNGGMLPHTAGLTFISYNSYSLFFLPLTAFLYHKHGIPDEYPDLKVEIFVDDVPLPEYADEDEPPVLGVVTECIAAKPGE